jgi:DNA-binding NtrC family response regulator
MGIPALVNHFIQEKARELQARSIPTLAPGAMDSLRAYSWSANVRELENVVERALILSGDRELAFDELLWAGKHDHHQEAGSGRASGTRLDCVPSHKTSIADDKG